MGRTRTEQQVARELEAWFAQRSFDYWPTYRTFVRDGHRGLYQALQRFGGPARWAAELGVPVIAHRRGAGFADAEVQGVLRNLLRDHPPARFPTRAWLRRNGPPGLAAAVQRSGGTAHWAGMLRMPAPPPAVWTDERIEAELRRVCAGATRWPSKAEFEHAGALGVLGAIYRGHGTHWWAQRIGLQADGLRPRRKA